MYDITVSIKACIYYIDNLFVNLSGDTSNMYLRYQEICACFLVLNCLSCQAKGKVLKFDRHCNANPNDNYK